MNTGKTRGYVLTFRCINCGEHETFANYSTDVVVTEDKIRGRIYGVRCNSCGWSGDVCGVSAIRISHADPKARAVRGQGAGS